MCHHVSSGDITPHFLSFVSPGDYEFPTLQKTTLKEYGNTVMPTLKWLKICLTTLLGLFSVDVNTLWSNWKSLFHEIMCLCVPSKTILLLAHQKLWWRWKREMHSTKRPQELPNFQSGNCTIDTKEQSHLPLKDSKSHLFLQSEHSQS